ncbi:hypothetical protein M409DRAFT_20256 [Zasmidium cellare ATCC 36951]|uniref:Uncharacterized protein n=1 Tax=Zasmidium cellare ATCC 36951 TaxID=1080233 RepID=A0A6A6CT11_ZASCE|nr:uncharacterized protein M409DRAFT_20256 [Zasmidium cellare ATCC 36951]KAF2169843.1 hypothetical protein M409DRAFT_20256 [Zasmidium cellare ATCC 36951]
MPDQKNDSKKSGLRGIFKRKESSPGSAKPASDTISKPQDEQSQRPRVRRTYTPRYVERDMILSVPVEDRPDLVAKAKETNLKRTCSDIGFSTGSSSRSSSSHARTASLNLNAVSTHPNLHISRNATFDPATPGSSSSSLRSLAMQRHSSMPAVPLYRDMQWKGLSYNGPPAFPQRPRPRTIQSQANIPQMIPESQVENVDGAMQEMSLSAEEGEQADNDASSRASTPSFGYTPEIARRPNPAPVRQKPYFTHKGPLPDLRSKTDKGKGKEQAGDWEVEESTSSDVYERPSHRAWDEPMSNYVISTKPLRASQTSPARLAPPPPPPPSNSGSSASSASNNFVEQTKDSRAPSLTESESNTTDRSSAYIRGSPRSSSVSTALTSDAEDGKTEKTVKLEDESGESVKSSPYAEGEDETESKHADTIQRAEVSL